MSLSPTPIAIGRIRRRDREVVDHQAAWLVVEHAVHASDGLHEPVAAHRLVDVHGVERRGVEAGQPHVADEDDLERVLRIAKPFGEGFSTRLVARVPRHAWTFRGISRHDDLERALLVVVVKPGRAQSDDLVVKIHADAPAHADHHRLAVHRFQALVEVIDDVPRDELQ